MTGAHRAMIGSTSRRAVRGALGPELPREVRARAERALDLLEGGLGAYAPKDGAAPSAPPA